MVGLWIGHFSKSWRGNICFTSVLRCSRTREMWLRLATTDCAQSPQLAFQSLHSRQLTLLEHRKTKKYAADFFQQFGKSLIDSNSSQLLVTRDGVRASEMAATQNLTADGIIQVMLISFSDCLMAYTSTAVYGNKNSLIKCSWVWFTWFPRLSPSSTCMHMVEGISLHPFSQHSSLQWRRRRRSVEVRQITAIKAGLLAVPRTQRSVESKDPGFLAHGDMYANAATNDGCWDATLWILISHFELK